MAKSMSAAAAVTAAYQSKLGQIHWNRCKLICSRLKNLAQGFGSNDSIVSTRQRLPKWFFTFRNEREKPFKYRLLGDEQARLF